MVGPNATQKGKSFHLVPEGVPKKRRERRKTFCCVSNFGQFESLHVMTALFFFYNNSRNKVPHHLISIIPASTLARQSSAFSNQDVL